MSHCRCGKLYPWSIGKTPAALNVTADHGSVDRNWYGANAVTIHPAAGGGQVPRQPARLKSAPPEGSAAPGRFFMRPAVGVRGSFAVRGSWIAGIVFYLLFSPARFKSGRPHHLAGTPYRFHKAHDGFLHDFSPSPGVAGVPLRARPGRRPRKAVTGLCALFFVSRVLPGGIGPAGHGRPDAFLRKKIQQNSPFVTTNFAE